MSGWLPGYACGLVKLEIENKSNIRRFTFKTVESQIVYPLFSAFPLKWEAFFTGVINSVFIRIENSRIVSDFGFSLITRHYSIPEISKW